MEFRDLERNKNLLEFKRNIKHKNSAVETRGGSYGSGDLGDTGVVSALCSGDLDWYLWGCKCKRGSYRLQIG